jgi:hypothetical protein
MTLDQLKAQRETLLAARFNGVLTIKAGDKWVTYRSDKELADALTALHREIASVEGKPRARRIRTVCGKGL